MGEFLLQKNREEVSIGVGANLVDTKILSDSSDVDPEYVSAPTTWLGNQDTNRTLYEQQGLELLASGKVAILLLAGGLSTRFETDGLRGDTPIGPVTKRTLFRLQGEKIAAVRERYAPRLLWLVMTSGQVHHATQNSFRRETFFGFPSECVWFFMQSSYPVVDASGEPIVLANGELLECPGGHGGLLEALQSSGMLTRLQEAGIEYLFHFQYPNVLENVADPAMLGYHHACECAITVKAINEYLPEEPLGKCLKVNERLEIREYQMGRGSIPEAMWNRFPASTGTFVWSVTFLAACARDGIRLPYHVLPFRSRSFTPRELFKIEQFAPDLMKFSSRNGLAIVTREDEFAPVKTAQGPYSVESGRLALSRLYRKWLGQAGGIIDHDECTVEITPRYALNSKEVQQRIRSSVRITDGMVFDIS